MRGSSNCTTLPRRVQTPESMAGRVGTRVAFWLVRRLRPQRAQRDPTSRALSVMRFMSERATHAILVVDECPGLGAALAGLFTCEGFRVHSASNGLEALDVLDREDVELVLSDVNMPDCDGFELLTRVKTRRAEGPVVLLHTGNTSVDLERGFLLGAEAIYFKPVEADTLVSAIHSYLPPGARAAPICQACGESGPSS